MLVLSSRSDNLEMIKYLFENYNSIKYWDDYDDVLPGYIIPILKSAIIIGNVEMFRYFHEKYPNVVINNNEGILNAALNGHLDMFKYLVKTYNLQVSELNLQSAAKNGHLEIVKYILKISPNLKLIVDDEMKLIFDVFYFTV